MFAWRKAIMKLTKMVKHRENGGEEGSNHEPPPGFSCLPIEVVTDILLRLPTRSVGRFRCVSKPFCSLLSDPKFAKNHLDLTLQNGTVRSGHRRLILSLGFLYMVDLDSIGEGIRVLTAVELDYPLKERPDSFDKKWVEIVGSSNGLVCIHPDKGALFLYNPTTGESKRIPDFPERKRIPTLYKYKSLRSKLVDEELVKFQIHGFGFGYDTLTDDYKVVKIVDSKEDDLHANVYSLKTDSWRRIQNLRYDYIHLKSGVHLNGAIHWLVHLEQDRVIAVFDLKTEEFREISLPDEANSCRHRFMKLEVGILKGCLCVVYRCYEMHDDIWVMNEYGVESSWSKIQLSVSYISMKPLCSTKNDEEVLLVVDEHLVLYNFESNTSMNLEISGVDLRLKFEANTYVESLISPNSYVI